MTKREEKIAKYVAMLNDLKKKCMAGEIIPTREFCALHQVGHMSVKAAIHFGYAKKLSHQRFKWIVTGDVTPIMAKCIIDWNTAYTISSKHKKKDASTNIIVGDVHIAKDDCEITRLKYQAMLDHQKIVDLEAELSHVNKLQESTISDLRAARKEVRYLDNTMIKMSLDQEKEIAWAMDEIDKERKILESTREQLKITSDILGQVPTVTYYLFGIPVWKRKEKVSR